MILATEWYLLKDLLFRITKFFVQLSFEKRKKKNKQRRKKNKKLLVNIPAIDNWTIIALLAKRATSFN